MHHIQTRDTVMNAMNVHQLPDRLTLAVGDYVTRSGRRPVSVKKLVRATSYLMPEMKLSESELAEALARKLIDLGCNIDFDMHVSDSQVAAALAGNS